jgi:hypothetical protein
VSSTDWWLIFIGTLVLVLRASAAGNGDLRDGSRLVGSGVLGRPPASFGTGDSEPSYSTVYGSAVLCVALCLMDVSLQFRIICVSGRPLTSLRHVVQSLGIHLARTTHSARAHYA